MIWSNGCNNLGLLMLIRLLIQDVWKLSHLLQGFPCHACGTINISRLQVLKSILNPSHFLWTCSIIRCRDILHRKNNIIDLTIPNFHPEYLFFYFQYKKKAATTFFHESLLLLLKYTTQGIQRLLQMLKEVSCDNYLTYNGRTNEILLHKLTCVPPDDCLLLIGRIFCGICNKTIYRSMKKFQERN